MPDTPHRSPLARLTRRPTAALAAVALLAVGGGAGALAVQATRPSVTMAPATPVAIRSLASDGIVTVRGNVAEIYGNKFIMTDASGRALVETGREGENGRLVTVGEPVTVQGRFDRGFIHAAFLVGPDSKVTALGPLAGPPHGPHGDRGPRHGPEGGPDGGPGGPPPPPGADRADNAPPPPPAPAATAAPAPAPTAATRR